MSRNNNLLKGNIYKQIIIFAIPILIGNLFQQLYNTVDAVIVGNFVGKQALAAIGGTTGTLTGLIVNFIVGIASGATVIIAQYYGSRNEDGVKHGVNSGMFIAILLGLIMSIIGIIFSSNLLQLLNVPEDIFDYANEYIKIYFLGLVPMMIYNMGSGVLRATGDSKRPLYFLIVSCFTNIILDILFVCVFKMEVKGVAYATLIATIVSCLLTLYVLKKTTDLYHFELFKIYFKLEEVKKILIIGLPAGIQSVSYSISNLFIQAVINGFGTDIVAAFAAYGKVDVVFWTMSGAIGTSCMTICAQNFGAKQINRVKETIRKGLVLNCSFAIICSLLFYFFGKYPLYLFTSDSTVIEIGISIMKYLVPSWILFADIEILSSSICGCGDSFSTMLISVSGIAIFRVIYLIIIKCENIFDCLRCYPLSWLITSIIFIIYYASGIWLKRSLKKRDNLVHN